MHLITAVILIGALVFFALDFLYKYKSGGVRTTQTQGLILTAATGSIVFIGLFFVHSGAFVTTALVLLFAGWEAYRWSVRRANPRPSSKFQASHAKKFASSLGTKKLVLLGVGSLVVLGVVVLSAAHLDEPEIDTVRDGVLEGYNATTVGKAFEGYFQHPKWTALETDKGATIVEFNGTLSHDVWKRTYGVFDDPVYRGNVPVRICIQFTLSQDKKKFEVTYVDPHFHSSNPAQVLDFIYR